MHVLFDFQSTFRGGRIRNFTAISRSKLRGRFAIFLLTFECVTQPVGRELHVFTVACKNVDKFVGLDDDEAWLLSYNDIFTKTFSNILFLACP